MKRSETLESLIQQSTSNLKGYDDRFGNTSHMFFDKDKFAKLLVQHCAKICLDQAKIFEASRLETQDFNLKNTLSAAECAYEDAAFRIKEIMKG